MAATAQSESLPPGVKPHYLRLLRDGSIVKLSFTSYINISYYLAYS